MKTCLAALTTCVVLTLVPLVAADPAYVGTWKFNPAKSQLTGDSVTITSSPDGTMTFDGQGFKYSFKADGKKYPTPDGGSASWTRVDPNTWDVAVTAGGNVVVNYRATVQGETMRLMGKLAKPDGTPSEFNLTYKRASSGSGIAGKWTSTEVNARSLAWRFASLRLMA